MSLCQSVTSVRRAVAALSLAACVSLCHISTCALAQSEITKLVPPDAAAIDHFGCSLALCGDVALVGAYRHDPLGIHDAGAAYVYRFDGAQWHQQQKLFACVPDSSACFGCAVDLDGDTALIGAAGDDDFGELSGSAYIFRFDGSDWTQHQKLLPSEPAPDTWFGRTVALAGDLAVIGADGFLAFPHYAGAAYVFRNNGSTWVEEAKLEPADGDGNDRFGCALALNDEFIFVGAIQNGGSVASPGAAYVFRYDGLHWIQHQKLVPADAEHGDLFGWSVALHDDFAFIAAPKNDETALDAGAVYCYSFDGSAWCQRQKLLFPDGKTGDWLGSALAPGDERLLVGAHGVSDCRGAACVFTFDQSSWVAENRIFASDGLAEDRFGEAVALDGELILVGASFHDAADFNAGAAYAFAFCPADINVDGIVDVLDLLKVLAHWGQSGEASDITGDGIVDVLDLLEVLASWGPCP